MNKIENKLNHTCFPQPSDSNSIVWRYMDFSKLVYTLLNNSLYLCRLDLLDDKFEGSITKINHIKRDLFYQEMGIKYNVAYSLFDNLQNKKTTFINCWRIDNNESEAMWKLYCPDNFGVAIQTSYQKLVDSLSSDEYLYIGLVKYIDYDLDEFPNNNMFYPIMHKRKAFEHEKEVRIVKSIAEYFIKKNIEPPLGIYIPWDTSLIIENIFVNPYAPEWYFDLIEKTLKRFGCNINLKWSNLKGIPKY